MKSTLKRLLPNSRFFRSVSVLAGGTAAGQLIVIAASPILTRLYTPEDFGLLAVYAGILGILGVIASLRYQLAIPLPKSDEEAASIAILSLIIVAITTLCSAVIVWLLGDQLAILLSTPGLAPHLWLIPIGLLLVGIYQVFQYWAIREKSFSNIAQTRVKQSLGMVITQVGGYAFGPLALLLGRVVGHSAGVLSLAKPVLKEKKSPFASVNRQTVKDVGGKYRKFPLVATWTGLASAAGLNLPPLLIAAFLGASSAGLFSLAHRVLSQPMTVIGKAVSDAFYQRAVEANREEKLGDAVKEVFSILVRLALAPAITMFLVIPELFVLVFGESWVVAGDVAKWMTPWLFFQFVVSPCTGIYPIIDRHDIALRFQLSLLIASIVGAILGGVYLDDLIWVVVIISVLSSLIYLWRVSTTFEVLGLSYLAALSSVIKPAPVSLMINVPVLFALAVSEDHVLSVLLGIVLTATLWMFFLVAPLIRKSNRLTHKV